MDIEDESNIIIKDSTLPLLDPLRINCWYYLFHTMFVAEKLDHVFSKSYDTINEECKYDEINSLLLHTKQKLSETTASALYSDDDLTQSFNYRDLITIRRIIMLFHNVLQTPFDMDEYHQILSLIANLESQYIKLYRHKFTLFNIHPPRSAGTFICRWFKKAEYAQKLLPSKDKQYETEISTFPLLGRNCNAGDGKQFTHYGQIDGKTCKQQYAMHNYTMIARESPLYPNKNDYNIRHPLLCDKFIYLFAFRSPIERIFSWAKADTKFSIKGYDKSNNEKFELCLDLPKMLPNFYHSLFDYNINKQDDNLINIKDSDDKKFVRIDSRQKFIRTYSSNAITKWIGYQWIRGPNAKKIDGQSIIESLYVSTNSINDDDIHFYNAIKLLLKMDFVLNFASYDNDKSAVNAVKYSTQNNDNGNDFGENIISGYTKMSDENSIWSVFADQMHHHFNISKTHKVFRFLAESKHSRISLADIITENDYKTLYEQNYFDFRLYALTKYIEKVDVMYYKNIFNS